MYFIQFNIRIYFLDFNMDSFKQKFEVKIAEFFAEQLTYSLLACFAHSHEQSHLTLRNIIEFWINCRASQNSSAVINFLVVTVNYFEQILNFLAKFCLTFICKEDWRRRMRVSGEIAGEISNPIIYLRNELLLFFQISFINWLP